MGLGGNECLEEDKKGVKKVNKSSSGEIQGTILIGYFWVRLRYIIVYIIVYR